MSLIDRYIAEVGRHLPEKDRSDIEAEIRSMLEDMLEERSESAGPSTDRVIVETLEELGDPKLLAAKYAPPKRYLIGPDWYEGYIKILQRVLFTALPIVAVVAFILSLTEDPLDFMNAVGEAIGRAFDVGIQILFWVTLVFILLERSDEKSDDLPRSNSQTWTVSQLPVLSKKRQINTGETVMNIASILFVLIWIALPFFLGRFSGSPVSVPFLHPNLWNFWLPVLFVLMGLTLVHEVFKLKIGVWTPALMTSNLILGVISIIYIVALVITQDVINPDFLAMVENSEGLSKLRETITWSINISAAIIAGTYVWGMVESILKSRQLQESGNAYVKNVVLKEKK